MSNNITKISVKPREKSPSDTPQSAAETTTSSPRPPKPPKSPKIKSKKSKSAPTDNTEKPLKSVFILARPFVALGRYLRDSWRELRMVRWPSRKATWKMTLAVLVYCAIFIVFIVLLDMLFTFIFNLIFGTN